MTERTLRGIDLLSLLFAAVPTLGALLGLLNRPRVCALLVDLDVPLPFGSSFLCSRAALFATCLVPLAVVVDGVVRKSPEASQVARCLVAMLAGAALVIALVSHLHFWSQFGY